ncbi:MAG: hypothetical protein IRY88_15940 [Rubrobacteraceae bacterium]|uniref:hypothetical protein n=1 Tax=Rubrobacter calidifluminis TaxID=1392640 RepID=UPI002361D367|nr:hypothetical protein [Rubrobacter calidifluminis]MBX6765148.1 hypothetical protein [Rubrobacteraceae bacterium]
MREDGKKSRRRELAKDVALYLLLLALAFSAAAGRESLFLCVVAAGWLSLPLLVGRDTVLDAGLLFMLVALGTFLSAALARLVLAGS